MAKAQRYNLNIDEFDSVVKSFSESENFEIKKEEKTTPSEQIIYKFYEKKQVGTKSKAISMLICYVSNGRISFSSGGKDATIAQRCQDKLISETEIKLGEGKAFTVKSVSEDDFNTIIEYLKEEVSQNIEELEAKGNIQKSFKLIENRKGSLHISFFENGTLLVQGSPSLAFQELISIAFELFPPSAIKKEHLKFFELSDDEGNIINSNLEDHLPNAYKRIEERLVALMSPSLILLNKPLDLSDYSAYAFPVLRGIEGVLKKIFLEQGIEIRKDFGEYFKYDTTKNKCDWKKETSLFTGSLKNAILNLYFFYYRNRHSVFHVDTTIDTTRLLGYEEALNMIQEGLQLIDRVYKHYN